MFLFVSLLIYFFKLCIWYWSGSDQQCCCDSFRWTAKVSAIHIHVSLPRQIPSLTRLCRWLQFYLPSPNWSGRSLFTFVSQLLLEYNRCILNVYWIKLERELYGAEKAISKAAWRPYAPLLLEKMQDQRATETHPFIRGTRKNTRDKDLSLT